MLSDHRYGASVSCAVSVYSPAFAGRLFSALYPRRDGQAELTSVAGYMDMKLQDMQRQSRKLAQKRQTSESKYTE